MRTGLGGLAILAGLGVAQAALWMAGLPGRDRTTAFAWRAALLAALYVLAFLVARRRRDRAALLVVLGGALVFRAAAWTWPPELSSDLHRYLWDGRVQAAGHSPYDLAPAAPELAPLRDDAVWPRINRPQAVTVYPPGAQLAFLALHRAGGDSTGAVRGAAIAADLAALALLLVVLRRRGRPAGQVLLYAWCPLVVAEVAVSGHVDALVLPMLVGALLLAEERRPAWAGAILGAATLVKLYPILLLAAVPRAGRRAALAAAAAVVALGYLPYVALSGRRALGFLPAYVRSGEDFNNGPRALVESLLAPVGPAARPLAMAACALALLAALAWIARRDDDPFLAARGIALAFLLFLPTAVHPWYALWLVPFLCVEPTPAGAWLVIALPLSYLKYGAPGDVMPAWVPPVEWVPVAGLLALSWWRARAPAEVRTP